MPFSLVFNGTRLNPTHYVSIFALPDGKVFMVANNQSIVYDVEANTETKLPDITSV